MNALDYESLAETKGLVPVVAQDALTGEVRMVAFASPEAVKQTLESGRATFWSRSRNELWEKGRTSGNSLEVAAVLVDCDADCVIYLVTPKGPTCHTGAATCFFRRAKLDGGGAVVVTDEEIPSSTFLVRLEGIIDNRKSATAASSYTKSLLDGGPAKIGAKLREEADELARAIDDESDDRVVSEAADVIFHLMVGLRSRDVDWSAVLQELERRTKQTGHAEKLSRKG